MILCCGEALIDMVPLDGAFKPCLGGSPFNTAIGIGRLETPVGFLSRISRDFFGDSLVGHLRKNGVSVDLVVRSGETSSLAFVQIEEGEEPRYAFYTEGCADRSLVPADLPPELPEEISCIAFGSIAMTMEPVASTIETLVRREHKKRVISLDPNVRPSLIKDRTAYLARFESWLQCTTIVKISGADTDYIYPDLDRNAAIERILSLGPDLLIMTLGKDGAMAVAKRGDSKSPFIRVSAPVVPVKVVDTIGAGDTFHAAFLAWLESTGRMSHAGIGALGEEQLAEALAFANLAASLVCTRKGAEPPTRAEMESWKKTH